MTPAEKRLWAEIRRKQIGGYSFYRQRPIDEYIVDFYCPDLHLVVEVDGRCHIGADKQQQDLDRQRRLETFGLQVLRFSDQEALHDIDNVIRVIEDIANRTSP